jgi:CubicO group peptidase (beta-lactamase class C family)
MTTEIHGFARPGFEAVRDRFSELAWLMGKGGAAFAATVDGETVVDLYAGWADHDRPWRRDTRVHIQSTSKAVTAFAAMLLVDRGQIELDAPVARYWPDYGCNGKEATTVRMLLSHSAGSTRLPGYTELLDLDGNGLDQYDEIARRLAGAEPDWDPGTAHGYHGYTYGNLVSELVYRVTGKRAGEFLRDQVFEPFNLNIWLGTPRREQAELAAIQPWPTAPMPDLDPDVVAAMAAAQKNAPLPVSMQSGSWQYDAAFRGLFGGPADTFSMGVRQLWSQPKALEAEFGAANATSDARSIARLYVPLANGGRIDGRQLVSENTVGIAATPAEPGGVDKVTEREMGWHCFSHHANMSHVPGMPSIFGPNPDAFGMTGGGGNFGFADPKNRVSGGFVRNHYCNTFALSANLVQAVYACL